MIKQTTLSVTLAALSITQAMAEAPPKWEIGLAGSSVNLPHYLGSDQRDQYSIALPYFIYRGRTFRADRNGLRGKLAGQDNWELSISVGGSFPVSSTESEARAGMDDLDTVLEIGPEFRYTFYKDSQQSWQLEVPLRGAFRLGSEPLDHQGWVLGPALRYSRQMGQWRLSSKLGFDITDDRLNQYFYGVDAHEVTDNRPLYQARAGYAGSYLQLGASRRFGKLFTGVFAQHYELNGAEFADSPLVRTEQYTAAGLALGYTLYQSKARAKQQP